MMPKGSAKSRGEQLATIDTICHEMISSKETKETLDSAEAQKENFSDWEQANLRKMRRLWKHKTAIDASLSAKLIEKGMECEHYWREARHANDFKGFSVLQQEVLNIVREIAQTKAEIFQCSPYEALLDQYDSGCKTLDIDTVFARLAEFLPGFIDTVVGLQAHRPPLLLEGYFPPQKQKELGITCMHAIGFDFDIGRFDESHHPFCGGHARDVRMTTRYNENDFSTALMGGLHETGHSSYEQNLPQKWVQQPVGRAAGMAIHESQSLLIETQACRSREFLEYIIPFVRNAFGVSGDAWTTENLYRYYSQVKRSLIRVDADEVTYPLHIILRYELEKELIAGGLEVKDLPEAWAEKMKRYLGIDTPNYASGCMQDIHWSDGAFGYFPTYTLGAINAAQCYKAACNTFKEIPDELRKGNFNQLMSWLNSRP